MNKSSKYLIYIVSIIIIITIVILILRKRKNESSELQVDTNKLSKSKQQLNVITEQLFNAMDRTGTDEDTIFNLSAALNAADKVYVFNQFGTRYYKLTGNTITSRAFGEKLNLFEWFKKELGSSDYKKLKEIWSDSGITWID